MSEKRGLIRFLANVRVEFMLNILGAGLAALGSLKLGLCFAVPGAAWLFASYCANRLIG
tara:strand:- start:723 stop:899 length:177 start_codon:yes stop_codon:yes gene_type:complete